jgi:hypothetical protein
MAHKFKREVKDIHRVSARDLLKLLGQAAPKPGAQLNLSLDSTKQYVVVVVTTDEVVTVD